MTTAKEFAIMIRHLPSALTLAALAAGTLSAGFATSAAASGPPPAATAFSTAVIGPAGGAISGFGMTATFAPGAVAQNDLVILGNWPNGLDVPPPSGQAVKTFGLQVCNDSTGTPTGCTSEFGNYPTSPAGTERIDGKSISYTAYQPGVTFGSAGNKLVTFTIDTGGTNVYVYNPNFSTTAQAYPKLLPSSSADGVLTFQTFQPIVWTVTSPTS
jgi:hypothetical protein